MTICSENHINTHIIAGAIISVLIIIQLTILTGILSERNRLRREIFRITSPRIEYELL